MPTIKSTQGVSCYGPDRIRIAAGDNELTDEEYAAIKNYRSFKELVSSGVYEIIEKEVQRTSDVIILPGEDLDPDEVFDQDKDEESEPSKKKRKSKKGGDDN